MVLSDLASFGGFMRVNSFRYRSTQIRLPHTPTNALFKKILVEGKRNYILVKRSLVMFKDPGSGEGIFTCLGFQVSKINELEKAV